MQIILGDHEIIIIIVNLLLQQRIGILIIIEIYGDEVLQLFQKRIYNDLVLDDIIYHLFQSGIK
jgi:hypothetical protein